MIPAVGGLMALALPDPPAQPVMELGDQPVLAPAAEEGINQAPCGEVRRHRPPRDPARDQVAVPWSQAGTGSNGRTAAHSASVISDGYRRTRSG